MDNRRKVIPILKSFLKWPLIMLILMVLMDIYLFIVNVQAGFVALAFTGIYAIVMLTVFFVKRRNLVDELVRFGVNYGQVQRRLSGRLELPYFVMDRTGCILWANDAFISLVGDKIKTRQPITDFIPEIKAGEFPTGDEKNFVLFTYGDMSFKASLQSITVDGLSEDTFWNSEKRKSSAAAANSLVAVCLYDETEVNMLRRELTDQEMIIGLLYIDNYDEALNSIDEVRRSLLSALVDRKINKYFQNYDTVIRKLEKDKYVLVMQNRYLEQLKASKFPILDEVRAVNIGNDLSVTISIGIGMKAGNYTRAFESARAAIELALGRGGDQVVIKGSETIEYFGGKSGSIEKNTRVKSRVKAGALRELLETKDKVLIMGHAMGDVDSFGAAVGVFRMATFLNKEAHIVMGEVTSSLRVMVNKFTDNPDYSSMIVSPSEALNMIDPMTIVIVVDVNRASYSECPELVAKAKSLVVIDHHRQTTDSIDNAALSYVETSASSACEIVSELIQYIGDDLKLKTIEADAMFAGIMIDSNNFLNRTGIRTFEAAAYLRKSGADVTRIRKAFRTDMTEYVAKARAIASAEVYLDNFAFAVCDARDVESPTILGAQVANEMMDINNIKASFVFTDYNNMIYVSARSIDEVNVQVVMEKVGGGGHMSVAGAQFTDCVMSEAIDRVKAVVAGMREGGEI